MPARLRHAASMLIGRTLSELCMAGQRSGDSEASVVLSFDCDFPADVEKLPALAESLQSRGIRGSFAVVGTWVEKWPDEHRSLVDGGHEIINHTHTHPRLRNESYDFASSADFTELEYGSLTRAQRREEILRCHEAVRGALGISMEGCRLPHFGNLDPGETHAMLVELGYAFSSSILAVLSPTLGAPYAPVEGLWEIPVAGCPRHPFVAFDTWHCLVKDGGRHSASGEFGDLLAEAAERAERHGALLNLYLDPKDVVGNSDFHTFLDGLASRDSLHVTTYSGLIAGFG